MTSTAENNKRIAKNTLLLYIRMFFNIIVGLYTSRVVLEVLGVSDYGVYNVVGGIVAMFAFLNSAMTAASQRFISYELGTGNLSKLKKVFSTSVEIHVIIAFIVFILAETIGLWFLNNKLNILPERMVAANWVYQSAILSFMLTVISVPYNASIVAHEHMNAFAYIGILDTFLNLLAVLSLRVVSSDKLIAYAVLILSKALVIRLIYGFYCKVKFEECTFRRVYDKQLFREMFSFAGWSLVGNMGFAIKDQGSNIVLNLFYGTTLNAARGLAIHVSGIVSNFSSNFIMAINPQITKQYAAGNIKGSIHLVYRGCRFSFFLMSIIVIPVLINIDYLLTLWLGENVPPYTSLFLFYTLWASLIASMASPIVCALQATGKIMIFQVVIFFVMVAEMPLAYLILKLGYDPYYMMFATLLVTIVGLIARIVILKHQVPAYSVRYFLINIVGWNFLLVVFCYIVASLIRENFEDNFVNFILTSVTTVLFTALVIYILGLTRNERVFVNDKLKGLINRRVKHW